MPVGGKAKYHPTVKSKNMKEAYNFKPTCWRLGVIVSADGGGRYTVRDVETGRHFGGIPKSNLKKAQPKEKYKQNAAQRTSESCDIVLRQIVHLMDMDKSILKNTLPCRKKKTFSKFKHGTWTVTTKYGIYFRMAPSWGKKAPEVINCDEQIGVVDIVKCENPQHPKDKEFPDFALCDNGLYLPILDADGELLVMTTPPADASSASKNGGKSLKPKPKKSKKTAKKRKLKKTKQPKFVIGDRVVQKEGGRKGEVEDYNQELAKMRKVGIRWDDGWPDWSLLSDFEVKRDPKFQRDPQLVPAGSPAPQKKDSEKKQESQEESHS